MIRCTDGVIIITISFRGWLPIYRLIRRAWLDWHMARCDPMAPFLHEMVPERNSLK